MRERIRVGLIGCGRIARVHRSYLASLPQVEIVGVTDADDLACRRFAGEFGLTSFGSATELVERGRAEVVHVLTPPQSHAPLAIKLLEAGVNVLVEKPLALEAEQADAVLSAARRANRWVSVDHNRWFDPVVQRAARQVEWGSLGDLVGVDVFQGAEAGEADKMASGAGHWTVQLPGGLLHNLASHPLYLMRRFAGPVRDLRVLSKVVDGGHLEEVRLIAVGERSLASVTMSLRAQPFMNRLTLLGTRASLEVNLNNMTLIERRPKSLPKLLGKVWPNLNEALQLTTSMVQNALDYATGKQRFYPGIGIHLRELYARVAAGAEPPVSAAEGRDVVFWYDEILRQSGLAPAELSRSA